MLAPAGRQSQLCTHLCTHGYRNPCICEGGVQSQGMCGSNVCGCTELCCTQYTCECGYESGTEGCLCFCPTSPEVARDTCDKREVHPALVLKGFVPSVDPSPYPGKWTRQDRDSILDAGVIWPETSLQPSLGCLSSWERGQEAIFWEERL